MSRGHNPLIWMMACAVPTAGNALGLGEIHVDSALNEPLAAEIDIVGAEPEELVGLIATVANRDTFAHFGAERPAFLNNTTFKVTKDARGKPILSIRSTESFTEPLIDFVVDLRWRNGQLIRQYSLLLDPAGYPSATQMATALPVPPQGVLPAPVVTSPVVTAPITAAHVTTAPAAADQVTTVPVGTRAPSTVAADAAASGQNAAHSITVGAKATLHGIAVRAGARSDADINRMMIAIFRANPGAFTGNINRLRMGATLRIPGAEEVAAISSADANRETRAQMREWRDSTQHSFATSFASRAAAGAATATSPTAGAAQINGAAMSAAAASTAPASTAPPATATPVNSTASKTAPANAVPAITTPANTAPANTGPANTAPANTAPANSAPTNTLPATAATAATVAANAAPTTAAPDATNDRAALESKILSLEGTLQEIQTQLQSQQEKLSRMQAQSRLNEQHAKAMAAPPVSSDRGLLRAALAGMAVLAGACVVLLMRLRRRAKTSARPSIEKVPVVAPVEALAPVAPVARPKPAPAPAFTPEAARIEVYEEPLVPRTETHPEPHYERHEPMESALELSTADTAGINAAQLREELAAAKLREEIAAAWALPAAESYKRDDFDPENTLAQDIAKSLEDTLALQAAMTGTYGEVRDAGDTVETLQHMSNPGETAETLLQAGYPGDTVETLTHVNFRGPGYHADPASRDEPNSHDPYDTQDTRNDTRSDTRNDTIGHTNRFSATEFPPAAAADAYPGEFDAANLDFDFMEMGETHDTVNMKGQADDATKSATDRIKISGDVKAAAEKLELGADDPKLSPHDPNFANCA